MTKIFTHTEIKKTGTKIRKRMLLALSLGSFAILGGCESFKEKKILTGTRESLMVLDQQVLPDPTLAHKAVEVPQGIVNDLWSQAGGSASHSLPPLALSDSPGVAWRTSVGVGSSDEQRLAANVVVDREHAYTLDAQGNVRATRVKDGTVAWSFASSPAGKEGETLGGGLAVGKEALFVVTSFGDVIALSTQNGKEKWKRPIGVPMRVAPTLAEGRLFVVTVNNELFALQEATGEELWMHAGMAESVGILGGASPAVAQNVVVVTYTSGEIFALQLENGTPLWSDTLGSAITVDSVSSIAHIRARPIIDGDFVYVVSHGGRVVALDLKSGVRVWQKDIGGIRSPAVAGPYLFMLSNKNEFLCLQKEDGNVRWAVSLPQIHDETLPLFWAGPTIAGNSLILVGSNGDIDFRSIQNGTRKKVLSLSHPGFLSAVVANKVLYVLNENGELVAWK